MSKIREKQIAELKSYVFLPFILLAVAWVAFFIISSVNASKDGIPLGELLAVEIPVVVLTTAVILCFYIPLFRAYFALKAIPQGTPTKEKSIHCVKVKFMHNGGVKINYRRFCGVVLTDTNGIKYIYILEESQFKDKENTALYKAYEGATVTLVCYGDTNYIEQIRG